MFNEIPLIFYREWYHERVKPNLTKHQKLSLLKKLSDFTLEHDITSAGVKIPLKIFPELANLTSVSEFTGLQIYAAFTEMFEEIYGKRF